MIGVNEAAFTTDMRTLCATITGQVVAAQLRPRPTARAAHLPSLLSLQAEEDVQIRWRDKGKYRSLTITLRFEDADTVYAVYDAINKDPRVKYKL